MKYVVLLASILIQICLGGLYAWSSFVPALHDSFGLSSVQTQLVFGSLIAVFTISMVFSGRILAQQGPRLVACIGGILFGAGYCIASFSDGSFPLLLLGIGIVAGAGTGFGYVCPLVACMTWFPSHKGFIAGISVAGFGGGAVLLSILAEQFFVRGIDVLTIFRWIGLLYGATIVLAAMAMRFPPNRNSENSRPAAILHTLMRDPFFMAMVIGIFCGTFAGLLVIGNLKTLALSSGILPTYAALTISAFAAGNAAGRIAWGWIADIFGELSIFLSLSFLAGSLFLLRVTAASSTWIMISSFLTGFGFGACFIVYAEQVASRYGPDRIGSVYPLVFLAYGAAGIMGPGIGGFLYDATDSYTSAITISIVVVMVGLLSCSCLLRKSRTPEPSTT